MTTLILALIINPYAGNYSGTYRAGFVTPKPITATIHEEGTTNFTLSNGAVLVGDTSAGGAFDVKHRIGWRWTGSLRWNGGTLVGTFATDNPLVRGQLWLVRK